MDHTVRTSASLVVNMDSGYGMVFMKPQKAYQDWAVVVRLLTEPMVPPTQEVGLLVSPA